MAKVFEKCILSRLLSLSNESHDITHPNQHGFKAKHSTETLLLDLQSRISEALDRNEYLGLVSIDLSAAFDVVNKNLLIKRMNRAGIPNDVVSLIDNWLTGRMGYVECGSETSEIFDITDGTVQGSVLGPILFAIFVSPMFDKFDIDSFADDGYLMNSSEKKEKVLKDLSLNANKLAKWFRDSGLVVNESKTEFCLFHKNQRTKESITINQTTIFDRGKIVVLGVILDQTLSWEDHIANLFKSLSKINSAFCIFKKYFTTQELISLATSLYYSKMYYCSSIWLTESLSAKSKKKTFINVVNGS